MEKMLIPTLLLMVKQFKFIVFSDFPKSPSSLCCRFTLRLCQSPNSCHTLHCTLSILLLWVLSRSPEPFWKLYVLLSWQLRVQYIYVIYTYYMFCVCVCIYTYIFFFKIKFALHQRAACMGAELTQSDVPTALGNHETKSELLGFCWCPACRSSCPLSH